MYKKNNKTLSCIIVMALCSACKPFTSDKDKPGNSGNENKPPIIREQPLDPPIETKQPQQPGPVVPNLPTDKTVTKNNLYVSSTGSDNNDGSESRPFKTIQKAAQVVEPNTTVHVLPGLYDGGIQVTKSGREDEPIYFEGFFGHKSKIINSKNDMMFDVRGNYVYVDGFEFDGSSDTEVRTAIFLGGSYNVARNNKVHHIADKISCTSAGAAGIKTDNYFGGINNDVINNVVHNIGSPNCKFDQGIYLSTPGKVTNNLIYKVSSAAISSWHNARNLTITHNTVFASDYGITIGSGDYYNGNKLPHDNTIVANNIVFDNFMRGIDEQGKVGNNNRFMNNLVFQNGANFRLLNGKQENTILRDPMFINYKSDGSGDYRLKPNSPAINAGKKEYMPQFDLVGTVRVQPDIGAYAVVNKLSVPIVLPESQTSITPSPQ